MITPLMLLGAAVALPSVPPRDRVVDAPSPRVVPTLVRWAMAAVALVIVMGIARNHLLTLVSACIVGATGYRLISTELSNRAAARRGASVAQLATVVVGELRSGASLPAAMRQAGEDLDEPRVRECVLAAARRAAAGGSGAHVLLDAEPHLPELADIGRAWAVAERYGIAQAALLEQTRARIDTALAQRRKIVSTVQGAQVTAIILSALPLLGVVLGFAMGVNVVGFLTCGGLGGWLLVVGVGLECGGLLASQAIMERASCSS